MIQGKARPAHWAGVHDPGTVRGGELQMAALSGSELPMVLSCCHGAVPGL